MAGEAPDSGYPAAPPAHWPARLPPPESTPPPPGQRGGAAPIIAGAVVFAIAVTYGLGIALVRANDPGRRIVPATLPAPTTSTPVEGLVPLQQAVPALIAFVEQQRGSRFDPEPQVLAQDGAQFAVTAGNVAVRDLAV